MRLGNKLVAGALAGAATLALSACGGGDTIAGGETVNVTIGDAGCGPAVLKLDAGPKNFVVSASGSGKVTEYEILDGTRIVAERENITPGSTSKFALDLKPGRFTSYCPHGNVTERGVVIVAAGSGPSASPK